MDGANAEVPYSRPNILMSRRRNPHSYAQADIYVPVGYAGVVPGVKIDESMEYYSYSSTDETIQGTTMGIQSILCIFTCMPIVVPCIVSSVEL